MTQDILSILALNEGLIVFRQRFKNTLWFVSDQGAKVRAELKNLPCQIIHLLDGRVSDRLEVSLIKPVLIQSISG